MKNLWLRVGMTLKLTDEEAKSLFESTDDGYCDKLGDIVRLAQTEGRLYLDGETYVPECAIEDFNLTYRTSYEVYPISTDI